jgi:3-phenylpropionate/trans-cinnamate dioxygenase ferredoxin component
VTSHRVGTVDDVAPGAAHRVVVDGRAITIVRIDDDFYAIGDRCSHADVSLSEGEIDPDTRQIECWKHGSCFSLETGEPDTLPATRPVPVYKVWADGADLMLEVETDE